LGTQFGERTFAFIDGPNLHATVRALGFEIDYRKLLEHLRSQGQFIRVLYYTAIVEDQEFSTFRPLADWLDYNGYTMVTKPARGYTDSTGRRRFRTSMDVELAVDAMRLADKADHIILFSGEQSFASLVAALQQMGKRVTVVSTIETQPAMVADELRRQADHFVDIDQLQGQIARAGRTPRPSGHSYERDDRFRRGTTNDDENSQADDETQPVRSVRAGEGQSEAMEAMSSDAAAAAASSLEWSTGRTPPASPATIADVDTESEGTPAPVVARTVRRRRTQT
jgi:uncharacterized LabA/DUF88 family protein